MGINERKLKEKELRIKQIRDSAAALFYKKGYEATTIEDIAKLAEISKGTIYLYFKSKIDLFSEGINRGLFQKLNPKMTAIVFWNTFMGIIQFQENRLEKGKVDYRRSTINSAMKLIIRGIRK